MTTPARATKDDVKLRDVSPSQEDEGHVSCSHEAPGAVRLGDKQQEGGFQGLGCRTGSSVQWGQRLSWKWKRAGHAWW